MQPKKEIVWGVQTKEHREALPASGKHLKTDVGGQHSMISWEDMKGQWLYIYMYDYVINVM